MKALPQAIARDAPCVKSTAANGALARQGVVPAKRSLDRRYSYPLGGGKTLLAGQYSSKLFALATPLGPAKHTSTSGASG